jgi:tRNA A-37 threonylcarbamoyl transferase component Bud32
VSGTPPGFQAINRGRLRLIVWADVAALVAGLLEQWARGSLAGGRPLSGGRGGTAAFDLSPSLSVVLRPYRRGGLLRHLNRDLHFGLRTRPLHELALTEYLRVHGVPTVEVLGAGVSWLLPGCYRGALVTREVTGAANLWEYLQAVEPKQREQACVAVAKVTRSLHAVGVIHPDLNLQNYLVRVSDAGVEALVIDCDRARVATVNERERQAAFWRLCRSIQKLDPTSAVITFGCVEALRTIVEA